MYKTPKMPKISVVKKDDVAPSLAVSGKNIFKEKNNMFANSNANEFTFSPREMREVPEYHSVKKQSAAKNPFERNLGQSRDLTESISKDEMFARLGITNPQAEQVADLSVPKQGMQLPRTKKEAANTLISNLETEIEKLKYKRDTYIADRQREQKERELASKQQQYEEEEAQIILHKDIERMQQLSHPISSLEKPTLDNVEALLRAHKEKMQQIERQYMEKKKRTILETDDHFADTSAVTAPKSTRDVEVIKLGKENKASYERPKSSKMYQKKKPWERNTRQVDTAARAKDRKVQKREYEKKFQNYLEDKKEELEHKGESPPPKRDFDVYAPTSPNPKRSISRNKWATENIVENDDAKQSLSPRDHHDHYDHRDHRDHRDNRDHREEQYRSSKPEGLKVSTAKSDKVFKEGGRHSRSSSPGRGSPTRSGKKNRMRSSSPGAKHKKGYDVDEEREFSESEVKLLLWVFNIMRKDGSELVDKEDICEYVLKSPQILELYDVDPANLRNNLYAFRTDTRDAMHFEEFLAFLQESRNAAAAAGKIEYTTEEQIRMSKSMKKSGVKFSTEAKSPGKSPGKSPRKLLPKSENVCVLSEETLETIKEIYHDVDKYDDLIVKRLSLIKRLREDVRIARILHKPAVHIIEIDKYLSMERLLRQIEEEETTALAEQKKSKEYISLNQFLRYFTNYETPDDLAEKMGEKTVSPKKSPRTMKAMEEDDQDVIEVNPKHMKFFKERFDAQPKKRQAYAETIQLIDDIRSHDHYKVCRWDPGRRKAMKFQLPNENIEQVLNRMENEAEKYISWEDFLQFFTRRGKPRRLMTTNYNIEEDMIKSGLASDPKDKGLQTGAKIVQNAQRDGYDSDPEFHTYSKDINYEFRINRTMQDQIKEEPRSSKEMSAKRSTKGDQSPRRSIRSQSPERSTNRDQMTQIRFDTTQGSPKRHREVTSPDRHDRGDRGRPKTAAAKPERDWDHSPQRKKPERDWDNSPQRNRSASFDDRREMEDEYPEEVYEEERRGRRKNDWANKSHDDRFGAVYKDARDLKYTVPDPFEFDMREKARAKSIRERKVEEMIREHQLAEERMMKHQFRANSVPGIVKTPLFDKIMHDQEQRRAQVKKNSIAITKMREAPFSFYLRDKEKPKKGEPPLNAEFGRSFKAQPIPAICQLTDVWKNMKEREEIDRKERVARLAQQNLLLASLPPRMAKHEKEKKEQELKSQINDRNMERQRDKKTFVANEVPDFERLHKQFQEHLDRKRRNKRPTETKPFMFQESKKGVTREYLDIENQYRKAAKDEAKRDPFESVRKLKETKPKIQPHTTKKMIAIADQRKKEREERMRKAEQLEKEEEERKAKYHKMKPIVQGSSAIVDMTLEKQERAKQVKEDVKKKMKDDQKLFEEKKKTIEEHVAKRPLLVEQEVERNKRVQMQAMKDLSKLNKIMKEAGVRDPKMYFNQDERDRLEDAEYLEKRGFKELRSDD